MTDKHDQLTRDLADVEWLEGWVAATQAEHGDHPSDEIRLRIARRHRELAETVAEVSTLVVALARARSVLDGLRRLAQMKLALQSAEEARQAIHQIDDALVAAEAALKGKHRDD